MSKDRRCFICLQEANECCAEHPHIVFCSSHKAFHSNLNEKDCFPFQILESPEVGRYMIASKNIKAGDIIFSEIPIAVGPNASSTLYQCISCYKKIDKSSSLKCKFCKFFTCNNDCFIDGSHQGICKFLSQMKDINDDDDDNDDKLNENSVFQRILPLKLLNLKNNDPKSLWSILQTFMDHDHDRREDSEYWRHSYNNVIVPLSQITNYEIDEIAKVVGIMEVNSYHIYNPDGNESSGYRGVFPIMSLMSHNCIPNARPIIKRSAPYTNTMIATVDITKDSEISINYVHLHLNTNERNKRLRENWYFTCKCRRCSDITELGLFTNKGDDEIRNESQELIMENEFEKLNRYDLKSYIDFYKKCSRNLQRHHSILNAMRKWLSVVYCRPSVDKPSLIPTKEMLQTKIEICAEYLEYLNIIEPGLSRNRGKTLYELSESSITLYFQHGVDTNLNICLHQLIESAKALEKEFEMNPSSFEAYIYKSALHLMTQLKNYLRDFT